MDKARLKRLLSRVKSGEISVEKALKELKVIPYQDLAFAKIDTHRTLRKGFPEVVFCEGKEPDETVKILNAMAKENANILATRASRELFEKVKTGHPRAGYHDKARAITIVNQAITRRKGRILILTAGTADIPVAEEAAVTADIMGNRIEKVYDVGIAGIHRLFDNLRSIHSARVIIVVAGMEGALPSVVAGMVDKPVIAVPTSVGYGANFGGITPLLAMLNSCAAGVMVVNIDNGYGAGHAASLINKL